AENHSGEEPSILMIDPQFAWPEGFNVPETVKDSESVPMLQHTGSIIEPIGRGSNVILVKFIVDLNYLRNHFCSQFHDRFRVLDHLLIDRKIAFGHLG